MDKHGDRCTFRPGFEHLRNPQGECPSYALVRNAKGRIAKVWCDEEFTHDEHFGILEGLEYRWRTPIVAETE